MTDGGIYLQSNDPRPKYLMRNGIYWNQIPITLSGPNDTIYQSKEYLFEVGSIPMMTITNNEEQKNTTKFEFMPNDWTLEKFAEPGKLVAKNLNLKKNTTNEKFCADRVCCRFSVNLKMIEIKKSVDNDTKIYNNG